MYSQEQLKQIEELKKTALEIEHASDKVSAKYTFVSTKQILSDLESTGWNVDKVMLKKNNPTFGKHAITLYHPKFSTLANGDRLNITVINSHDGQSSTQFFFGIYRLVCSNGLMVGNITFKTPRIRHVGYSVAKVQTALEYMQNHAGLVSNHVTAMQQTKLDDSAILQLAQDAIKLRGLADTTQVDLKQLVTVRRHADLDNSLWNVYNRIQESLMKGLFNTSHTVKEHRGLTTFDRTIIKKARAINSIDASVNLNRNLWNLAVERVK